MQQFFKPARVAGLLCFVAFASFLATPGCGGGGFQVTPAKGKVVYGGKPITTGSVSFSPIGAADTLETGKSATAAVGPDGTFTLTTYNQFDGAIIGKHRVEYVGSEGDEEDEEPEPAEGVAEVAMTADQIQKRKAAASSRFVLAGEMIVEVTAGGENNFTIELVPDSSASREE